MAKRWRAARPSRSAKERRPTLEAARSARAHCGSRNCAIGPAATGQTNRPPPPSHPPTSSTAALRHRSMARAGGPWRSSRARSQRRAESDRKWHSWSPTSCTRNTRPRRTEGSHSPGSARPPWVKECRPRRVRFVGPTARAGSRRAGRPRRGGPRCRAEPHRRGPGIAGRPASHRSPRSGRPRRPSDRR